MTKSQFRTLLILSVVIGLGGGCIDLLFPSLVPEGHRIAQAREMESASTFRVAVVSMNLLSACVIYVTSLVGLFKFRSWAPRLAVAGTALALFGFLFIGPQVMSFVAAPISNIASYLWGAVLALANTAPYRAWFVEGGDKGTGLAGT